MHCSEKWFNLLTICRKAGKLVMGFDPAKDEIRAGRAKGVFLTKDTSEKTRKEMRFFCDECGLAPVMVDITMEDVQRSVGRKAGVLCVCDAGFANRLTALAEEMHSDSAKAGI